MKTKNNTRQKNAPTKVDAIREEKCSRSDVGTIAEPVNVSEKQTAENNQMKSEKELEKEIEELDKKGFPKIIKGKFGIYQITIGSLGLLTFEFLKPSKNKATFCNINNMIEIRDSFDYAIKLMEDLK